ncbi:MAG: ester cyclase, partial [Pseudomonadota bacterium]
VWNCGNLDVLDEIIAPEYINHSPGIKNPIPGPEGLKPIVSAIRSAFPDLKYTIENIVISVDQVAVHTTMRGTHQGDFFGLAPTNKSIKVGQMQIERIAGNKIVEHWRITDDLTLMRQLGQIRE